MRQRSFLDDGLFRAVVLLLLFAILWAIVTDYHLEMPQKEEPEPLSAQDKSVVVWAFYIIGMIGAWTIYLVVWGESIRDSLRQFWKRHKGREQNNGGGEAEFFSRIDEEVLR